jgi:hypothetical protein
MLTPQNVFLPVWLAQLLDAWHTPHSWGFLHLEMKYPLPESAAIPGLLTHYLAYLPLAEKQSKFASSNQSFTGIPPRDVCTQNFNIIMQNQSSHIAFVFSLLSTNHQTFRDAD